MTYKEYAKKIAIKLKPFQGLKQSIASGREGLNFYCNQTKTLSGIETPLLPLSLFRQEIAIKLKPFQGLKLEH
ncbi:MAG: hypothetical protein ACRC62_32580 [Microcoleus sp.]